MLSVESLAADCGIRKPPQPSRVGHLVSLSRLSAVLLCAVASFLWCCGVVDAQQCYQNAVSMRFKPLSAGPPFSFLYANGQRGVEMMRSRVFPTIVVQILDSNGNVDVSESTSDITIRVTSEVRLASAGSTVPVVYGEAQITSLLVEGTEAYYNLTFTAYSTSPLVQVSKNATATALTVRNITNLQIPVNVHALAFAQNNSFVMYPTQPLTVVFREYVPVISLNVLNSQYLTFPTSSTLGSNYTVRCVPSNPLVTVVSGASVPVLDGEAVFDNLMLDGPSTVVLFDQLTFVLYDAANPIKTVATGRVTVDGSVVENAAMSFERRDVSFIASQGQRAYATAGVVLPPIRISLRSNVLLRSPDSSGLIVTATSPIPYALRGAQVGVINGIATFTNLTFDARVAGKIYLAFTAGSQGALPLAGTTIRTGWISVSATTQLAASMAFLPNAVDSFINYPGQKIEAVLFYPIPPIRIQILDSANNVDATSIIDVTAKASDGVQFSQVTKRAESGVVEFTTLQFTSSSASANPRISFTAASGSTSSSAAAALIVGTKLLSGIVTVAAAQANYNLRFQPYGAGLFAAAGIGSVATINVPLPRIIVELVTSAGTLDSSSSDISITATAPGATLSGAFLRVSSGVAVFDALMFVSETPGNFVITFTASAGDVDAAVDGKSISTGTVRVASGVTPAFGIRFAADSYIAFSGHVVPIPTGRIRTTGLDGAFVPPVMVELIDSAHNLSTSASTIAVQRLLSVGTGDGSPNNRQATFLPGQSRVTFAQIAISSGYAPVITFVVSGTTEAVNGQQISSGSLMLKTTAETTQPALMSIVAASSTAGARQSVSINSGEAMSFTIQMMDAAGRTARVIAPGASYSISASSSVPLRAPLTAVMNAAGVATFPALQFAQTVPRSATPIIVFTATTTSTSTTPNRVLPIGTGTITVIGPSLESGIDIVAQVLFDFSGFKSSLWIAALARRLNVETLRFLVTRVYYGTSADRVVAAGTTTSTALSSAAAVASPAAVNITANAAAVWYGTRLDVRILEPLATSRNTKPAWALANVILNIKTDCDSAPELYLRRTMNLTSDTTCDWFMFEDQVTSAQQCVLSSGGSSPAFCACYVALIQKMGMRCLGYSTLTDLCLNTLLGDASCTNPAIVSVCSLLQEAPVPRVMLLASGIFFGFLLIPLVYLKSSGFFHKLQRPEAHASFSTTEKLNYDESDLL